MTISELAVVIVAIALASGVSVWVSLRFAQAQQRSAFAEAIARLLDVKRQVATDAGSIANVDRNLEALKTSYEKLQHEVGGLASRVVGEFKDQQLQFMRNIEIEFARTVEKSKSGLEQAFVREIAPLVPSAQQQKLIIDKLMDLSGFAMLAMGKYQLKVVEAQSTKALEQTTDRVADSMKDLQADVKEVKAKLDGLPLLKN